MSFCAIALDVGSSSIKVGVVDGEGEMLFHKRIFFPALLTASSLFSFFMQGLNEAVEWASRERINVLGASISGNGPTWVALDGKKRENDVLFMWNEGDAKRIEGSSSLFAPRLSLFKSLYPDIFEVSFIFLPLVEYLVFCLGAEPLVALPQSRFLPFYWQDEDLYDIGIKKEKVPNYFVELGYKATQYKGIPIFAGPPDYVAALIGSSCLFEGKACDVAGSSEGINITVEKLPSNIPPNVRVMPSVIPNLMTMATLFKDSGVKFSKAVSSLASSYSFRLSDVEDNYIEVMEIISRNYFDGAFLPLNFKEVYDVVIQVLGLLKTSFDLLESLVSFKPSYALSGGHAKNEAYLKIKSHFTNRTFYRLNHADAELLGDAIIVFWKSGIYSSLQEGAKDLLKVKDVWKP